MIPTYNERDTIEIIIRKIFDIIPDIYILVVDDNSPDGTATIVDELIKTFPHLSIMKRREKQGLGKAYISAFNELIKDNKISTIITMDADMSHDPSYIPLMLEKRKTHDMVIGSRYASGGATEGWEMKRKILSFFGNLYTRLITMMPMHDITAGFNAISTDILKKVDLNNMGSSGYAYTIELKYLFFKLGAKIKEIPIIFKNRVSGKSKISNSIIVEGIKTPWKLIFRDSKYLNVLILTLISLSTHIIFFGHPSSVVFDEVHIGNYISNYLESSYFFDVHPPLAKLVFAFLAYLFGNDISVVDFTKIGNSLPQWIIFLRLIPIIAGIVLPIIIYKVLIYLNIKENLAFLAGILISMENSLIVQSRFLMVDSIILMSGFLSILLYFAYRKQIENTNPDYRGIEKIFIILSVTFAIICFCIKWIGLSFLGLIILFEIYHNYRETGRIFNKKSFKLILWSFGLFIFIYISLFAIHFKLLPKSGPGDAYMTAQFQKTLIGNRFAQDNSIEAKSDFFGKFMELQGEMIRANNSLTTPHQYSSSWYSWPLMSRTIYYWQATSTVSGVLDSKYIYFIGNPLLYWGGALSIITLLFLTIFKFKDIKDKYASIFILTGFFINFLPFMLIGRIMFLYHYAVALIFSIMAIIVLLNKVENKKIQKILYIVILLTSLYLFIFFSPLTYGLSLSDQALQARMWMGSWR